MEKLIGKTTRILNEKGYRLDQKSDIPVWTNKGTYIELRHSPDLVEFYVGMQDNENRAASFSPTLDCDTCIGNKNVMEYILETVVLRP